MWFDVPADMSALIISQGMLSNKMLFHSLIVTLLFFFFSLSALVTQPSVVTRVLSL